MKTNCAVKTADERYQFKPFPGSSHTWALQQCQSLPRSYKILDIGVGDGRLAAQLKTLGFQELYGVETDASAREHSKPTYRALADNYEALSDAPYDIVLLLDVLEHMTEPFEYFQRIVEVVRPGGYLLISVPNVAHWSVRFQLLLGLWVYTKRGLLDETHYHFFTRSHFQELLRVRSDLRVINLDASISPAEFALPSFLVTNPLFALASRVRLTGAKLWPGLCAYQHLAVVKREA